MAGANETIIIDNPSKFFIPQRTQAELLWFSEGFVVYKFPNEVKKRKQIKEITFSMELCSETIYYRDKYPSDISILINDVEIINCRKRSHIFHDLRMLILAMRVCGIFVLHVIEAVPAERRQTEHIHKIIIFS